MIVTTWSGKLLMSPCKLLTPPPLLVAELPLRVLWVIITVAVGPPALTMAPPVEPPISPPTKIAELSLRVLWVIVQGTLIIDARPRPPGPMTELPLRVLWVILRMPKFSMPPPRAADPTLEGESFQHEAPGRFHLYKAERLGTGRPFDQTGLSPLPPNGEGTGNDGQPTPTRDRPPISV